MSTAPVVLSEGTPIHRKEHPVPNPPKSLPLLPLTNGVVLPSMVVTLALETDEARAAADAAMNGDRQLLLVPNADGRYARVGTVARVESAGELPNGAAAVILRGLRRARIGAGVPAPAEATIGGRAGGALWVEADPIEDPVVTDRVRELTRELRAVVSAFAERRNSRRMPEALASTSDPGTLVDTIV